MEHIGMLALLQVSVTAVVGFCRHQLRVDFCSKISSKVCTKRVDWAKYLNRHSSKSIRVIKLSFCQNDPPIVKIQAWSLVYFLKYAYFDIQPSPNNYETPSTLWRKS